MERWLACKVSEGMFPEEVTVEVWIGQEDAVSFFASRDAVRLWNGVAGAVGRDAVDGRVRVTLLDEDERYGVVALPVEPLGGSRVARVPRQLLSVA